MVDFNYLKENESDFPHISNVNVYKYDNGFDYGRFDAPQMELQICSVPWDMGEAHIGNRTISGIGNVVYFETKAKRDKWFDDIPDSQCYRFTTKFKELHRSLEIDVPIPYDMCAKHNYLRVKYNKLANDNSPIAYEGDDGLREWFWFIREVEFLAPSTTRLHLLDDAFQTWIYDVNVSGMVLERGHAPMFAVDVDDYLSDPVNESAYLLTEDVNFGNASVCRHIDALSLNAGNMYACIATTANLQGTWGSKAGNDWKVPAATSYTQQGQPSVYVFAVAVANLNTFLANVTSSYPQLKQTVQGVFFASDDLLTLGTSFTFADVTCYPVSASRKTLDFVELDKSLFGYPSNYADIAKLYTSPYAHIEVTDENGNADTIRIEDTTGTLEVSAALSIAYPFVNIDAHLLGAGGDANATVTYKNVASHTFGISGQWYDTLRSWKVPTFAVVLDAATEYDYSTHFDRAQQVVDYTTTKDNEYASATTARQNAHDAADTMKTNTDASADTMKTNADASADLITDNALLTTTANSAITASSNASGDRTINIASSYNFEVMDIDNDVISQTATSTIQATEEQAAVATAAGAASTVANVISAAATGNVAGAVSSAISGITGGCATIANTAIDVNLTSAKAQIAQQSNIDHSDAATDKSTEDTHNQQTTATAITGYQNTLTSGQAANASATQKANATRDQTTQKANATRDQATQKANATRTETTAKANADRTADSAQSAIDNGIAQAALNEPYLFGTFANGDSATTKPMAMFAHIVTQPTSAISRAGDEFLRYGYMYDGQWDFNGNWNVGKYFTYWKLRDFWVSNLNVPDMYMDKLRFFLFGGVTIWRRPEYIGNVTVYDNFN